VKRRPLASRSLIQSERDLVKIEDAIRLLGHARTLLRQAKAPRAFQAACHAIKSAEGARRHCLCVTSRIVHLSAPAHWKVPHGLCDVCGHYGADCTGAEPRKAATS
jgi:hypothetical protein